MDQNSIIVKYVDDVKSTNDKDPTKDNDYEELIKDDLLQKDTLNIFSYNGINCENVRIYTVNYTLDNGMNIIITNKGYLYIKSKYNMHITTNCGKTAIILNDIYISSKDNIDIVTKNTIYITSHDTITMYKFTPSVSNEKCMTFIFKNTPYTGTIISSNIFITSDDVLSIFATKNGFYVSSCFNKDIYISINNNENIILKRGVSVYFTSYNSINIFIKNPVIVSSEIINVTTLNVSEIPSI